MTMHLAWIRVTAAAATTIATLGGQLAAGQSQYGPYAATPQYVAPPTAAPQNTASQYTPRYSESPYTATATAAPYGVQPTAPAQVVPTTQPPAYPTTSSPVYHTAAVTPYGTVPTHSPAPAVEQRYAPTGPTAQVQQSQPQYQPPRYQAPGARPTYPSLAQQPTGTVTPGVQPNENLPTPDPAAGYNASQYPSTSLNSYAGSDPGYMGGGYQDYGYGTCGCDDGCGGTQWFGGVYGLYMTRTQGPYRAYTAGVDTDDTGTPYFPSGDDVENYSDCPFLVPHWRGGLEVRLGCTFGIGDGCDYGDSCGYGGCDGNACGGDPCGCQPSCQPCCQQMFAWEVAVWGLGDEVQQQYVDGPLGGNFRYYGMVNYAGLEYDDGTGGTLPVNDFYNYQIPITGLGSETVLAQRVRTNFSCQNLELNILRLPLYTGGCDYNCGAAPFSLTGLCGVRYFRFDDDLEFGTEWAEGGQTTFNGWGNGTNELFHDINMENNLVGFQLGANMNYVMASRWNAFWDTNFGLYNNYITQSQRMYNPINGNAVFSQDGREANVNSSKNDIAFLGEMRLGGGYLFSPNWRGILAYRVIAASGVALAPDQIKPEYGNWDQTARIDADGSLIVHGIQAGVECNY